MKTIAGKKPVATVKLAYFNNFQGIGTDPMYERYESIRSLLARYISPEYQSFLAQPLVEEQGESLVWYLDEWTDTPERLSSLGGEQRQKYEVLFKSALAHFHEVAEGLRTKNAADSRVLRNALSGVSGTEDCYSDVFCYDGKVSIISWGMSRNPSVYTPAGVITLASPAQKFKVTFTDNHGWQEQIFVTEGHVLSVSDIPLYPEPDGKKFNGWKQAPYGVTILGNQLFEADVTLPPATVPPAIEEEPATPPPAGPEPPKEPRMPWYKRFWNWLKALPWLTILKWILWLLLLILLIYLMSQLFQSCENRDFSGCTRHEPINIVEDTPETQSPDPMQWDNIRGNVPVTGSPRSYIGIVPPVRDNNGNIFPIEQVPGQPDVVANRLNLYFEDDNADLNAFMTNFRAKYSSYRVVGYDDKIKWVNIEVPATERQKVRETINATFPDYRFFVVDEMLFTTSASTRPSYGWHIDATNVDGAWSISQGDTTVTVAVVDGGFDLQHEIFQGCSITAPYNVFTQSSTLDCGNGHGTHVAGIAAGNTNRKSEGAAGVAPHCKLMPVQVFDGEICTFSSLAGGIMYAIHQGADVVNVSIATSFRGLSSLPVESQEAIAQNKFLYEAMVWDKIFRVAKEKNCILVFAAGNDSILTSVLPEHRSSEVLVVAATDGKSELARFSNYGSRTDVSAPGVNILSAWTGSSHKRYKAEDGTSMAAPLVTGIVALMKSVNKNITLDQVRQILNETGKEVRGAGPQVNAKKAVKKAQQLGGNQE